MIAENERPPVWVGHIVVAANDIAESADFYISLGMREIVRNESVVVLELRGGTHLVITAGEPADMASFDLMADDLDSTHAEWTSLGLAPSDIARGEIHDRFTIADPAGTTINVNSTHVAGVV